MDSIQISLYNALAYTLVLVYWKIKHGFSIGLMVWGMFTLSAWCTYLFIQQPLYAFSIHYSNQKAIPYIYLFIMLYLLICPFNKLKPLPKGSIDVSHDLFIKRYMIFMIIVQCASVLINIPALIDALSLNQQNITEYKDFSYEESVNIPAFRIPILAQLKGWVLSGLKISNYALMFILPLCYNKYKKITYYFCIITIAESFFNTIIAVSRGQMYMLSIFCIFMYVLLFHYTTPKIRKYVTIGGSFLGFLIISFVLTISLGRFGADNFVFFLYKYFGEPMNNFNGLLFYEVHGTTNGSAYLFSFIYDLLGISGFQQTSEKWGYIEHITGVSGQYFYTFIGGFIIEFGKAITMIIVLILHFFFKKLLKCQLSFNIGRLLIITLIIYCFINGVFYFPLQGRSAFLIILSTIILYRFFAKNTSRLSRIRNIQNIE